MPIIDVKAAEVMQKVSDFYGTLSHFQYVVFDSIDVVKDGVKVQFSHEREGIVSRPNFFQASVVGDITNRTMWKDKDSFTVLDNETNEYFTIEFEGSIDELLDVLINRFNVSIPLADIFSRDMKSTMLSNIKTGRYLGEHLAVGRNCHHLVFTQDNIDWQVWVDMGDKPILRKLIITYKQLEGQPQYTAEFDSFESLVEAPSNDVFKFAPPDGAVEIDLKARIAEKESTKSEDGEEDE
jgi:hypothetical protein